MPVKSDIATQLQLYRGYIGWYAFTDAMGNARPDVIIELFIKNHPIPGRKPKVTEINTISSLSPNKPYETNTQAVFFGASELLQIAIEGWMITPIVKVGSGYNWNPVDNNGNPLNWGSITYPEVIAAYLTGKVNLSSVGAPQRKDPDFYATPYGQYYASPTISSMSSNYSPSQKKQAFSMSLMLEK